MEIKIMFLILVSLLFERNKDVNISFFINGKQQTNTSFYIVDNKRECYFIGEGSKISYPDTLTTKDITIYMKSNSHIVVFPIYDWKNCNFITIDFDCRLFKNIIKSKYGITSFKRNKYYIKETTVDDIISVSKPKQKYFLHDSTIYDKKQ